MRTRKRRVAEVLDQVAAEDDVERARLERKLHRLDVADEHVRTHVARLGGCVGSSSSPMTVHPRATSGRARYPLEQPTSSTRFPLPTRARSFACPLCACSLSGT